MRDDELLTRSIEAWRTPVPVRVAWRAALLRDIAAAPHLPRQTIVRDTGVRRVWMLRPATALTAAALLFVAGLALGALLTRAPSDMVAVPNATPGLTTVRFLIVAPAARQVSLVGDFNRWDVNAHPMRRSHDGQSWLLELPLEAGRHTYAFVVDGDVVRDPAAPSVVDDDFGVPNSIIFVADGRT